MVPEGYYRIPLGKARTVRAGEAMTILTYGTMVHVAEAVCIAKGVDAEIIDLRTADAARYRGDRGFGRKDGPLHDRPRGDPARRASGRNCPRLLPNAASTISKPRSNASPASTRPIPTASNGPISPGPVRIGEAIDKLLSE